MTSKLTGSEGLGWPQRPEKMANKDSATQKGLSNIVPQALPHSYNKLPSRVKIGVEQKGKLSTGIQKAKEIYTVNDPWTPYKPEVENANDVFMSDFKDTNATDFVFKPGNTPATRGEICKGIILLNPWLKNVIPATTRAKATVVARDDYDANSKQVKNQKKVHCPEADCDYVVEAKAKEIQIINQKKSKDGTIAGNVEGKAVTLTPVEDFPGFYHLVSKNKHDKLDFYVMIISTLPSTTVDRYTGDGSTWMTATPLTSSEDSFLFPVDEAIQITNSVKVIEKKTLQVSEDSSSGSDFTISEDEDTQVTDFKGSESEDFTKSDESQSSEIESEGFIESGEGEFESSVLNVDVKKEEAVEESEEKIEYKERYVQIDGVNYSIDVEKGRLSLYPVGNLSKFIGEIPKDIGERFHMLFQTDEENHVNEVLVPKEVCMPWNESMGNEVTFQGKKYEVDMGDEEGFKVEASEEDKTTFIKVNPEEEGDWYEDNIITTKHGQDYVTRNGFDYHVIPAEEGAVKIIGENISGMAQVKVQNIFQNSVDLRKDSEEREEFFNRIEKSGFIEGFIAISLLATQDGKVINPAEGNNNILFTILPNEEGKIDASDPSCKLRVTVIDVDETNPPTNGCTLVPNRLKPGESSPIPCVRNMLMGFPMASEVLKGGDKDLAISCLKDIISTKKQVARFLQRFVGQKDWTFKQENLNAYLERVNRIEEFLSITGDKDFSLQDLFLFIYPEYKAQWIELDEIPPMTRSMNIGKDSVEKALMVHRGQLKQLFGIE